jgi:hypothetical protein
MYPLNRAARRSKAQTDEDDERRRPTSRLHDGGPWALRSHKQVAASIVNVSHQRFPMFSEQLSELKLCGVFPLLFD